MNAFGAALREAREKKGVTHSEAAAATRIKVQVIEDLERGIFRRVYAPIYIKGFIRIYGEYLGLETETLLAAYQAQQQETGNGQKEHKPEQPPPRGAVFGKSSLSRRLCRAGAACAPWPRKTILKIRKLPWTEWRDKITVPVKTAIAATAEKTAGASPAAQRPVFYRRLRAHIRGPYRVPAAAIAAILLLLLIILSGVLTLRRNSKDTGIGVEIPDPGAAIEFTHEPPPPYY